MIRTETITIDKVDYKIRPLTGRHFVPFMKVLKAMSTISSKADASEIFKNMDDDTFVALHSVVLHSLKKAGIPYNDEMLEEYATQNMFTLLGVILKVNMPETVDDGTQ